MMDFFTFVLMGAFMFLVISFCLLVFMPNGYTMTLAIIVMVLNIFLLANERHL